MLSRRSAVAALFAAGASGQTGATLKVRTRVELFKGSDEWRASELTVPLQLDRTAVIICDMWDQHWCKGATARVGHLVEKANPFLEKLRSKKVLVIHAPSETMEFYKDDQRRLAMLSTPKAPLPTALHLSDPPLPIDDSKGGCDTGDSFFKAWKRQHPKLIIGPNDLISDKGDEVYSALKLRGITHLLVMGVHTNMCILNRSFAIKQMTRWGMKCLLIRDLTDSMYNPAERPFVSHDAGTELVVQHIEKYWAPSTTSVDILAAIR
ncbi:MAG: isochorismatase family protein [Acidobacteria bacterium]|nr:isochorismatase family protein [Acidobacteriota bacterium]